jgi:hypothetical protein
MRLPAAFVVGAAAAAGAADVEEVAVAELMILFECFRDGDCVAMRRPEEIDQCKMRHANFVISRFCSLVAAGDKHFQVNTSHTTHSSILGLHLPQNKRERKYKLNRQDGDRIFGHSRGGQGQHPSGLLLLAHTTVILETQYCFIILFGFYFNLTNS